MAQDYNIYLHLQGEGGTNKPTKPNTDKNKKTQPSQLSQIAKGISRAAGFINNPDSAIGEVKSVAMNSKAGPIALIVTAIAGVVTNLADKSIDIYSTTTGVTEGQSTMQNLKASVSTIFSPVSTVLGLIKLAAQEGREYEKRRYQAQLLGDSQLNQIYERKV